MKPRRPSKRRRLVWFWLGVTVAVSLPIGWWAFEANRRADPSAAGADGRIEGLTSVLGRELPREAVRLAFTETTESAGIRFTHMQAPRGSMLPEDMGPGLAWGDYDDDGDPDLYLVNFRGALGAEPPGEALPALYENVDGHFREVTVAAGLAEAMYGIGATWADYDGDGDLDLHVTCYGPNKLYRNDGGRFTDVAGEAGIADSGFGAGAAWADFDRDGDIDLYVANYVEFELMDTAVSATVAQYGQETPYTINPSAFAPAPNRLYRNDGNGTFTDIATSAGVDNVDGRSLSAAWMDFDADGWVDLYVANDVSDNGVYRSLGDGTFEDIGASSLAADYRGAMGLAVADPDGDADLDIFVTHWLAQENALFENMASDGVTDRDGRRRLYFMDTADLVGLGQATLNLVGWATGFADFDADGRLDLWLVNGHTLQRTHDSRLLRPQPVQIYQGEDDGYYEVGSYAAGDGVRPMVGRGGAHADYDGDGRLDLIMAAHGGSPRLLRNATTTSGNWMVLDLRDAGGNTRALGARVRVTTGTTTQVQQTGIWGNYLSQSDQRLHFGLGDATTVEAVAIIWPDGDETRHADLAVNTVHRLTRVPSAAPQP